jgi:hypothetical protein
VLARTSSCAERLLSVIDEGRTAKRGPLPYRQQAMDAAGAAATAMLRQEVISTPGFPTVAKIGSWPCHARPAIMHQRAMFDLLMILLRALESAFRSRANLALENFALRQQLANLRRTSGRPRVRKIDRAFWLVSRSSFCTGRGRIWTSGASL